ncbi:MAG TPA: hypothetical protein VJN93_03840 [Candidatus Acidoferrum sp.]|nr:hypothetical protein [Candidatus Acidoferrum sp.]
MAQTYLLFDFGTDEDKAQLARHKLDGWKQAFRLDKKLLYKVDRPDAEDNADAKSASEPAAASAEPAKPDKSKSKSKSAAKSKAKSKTPEPAAEAAPDSPPNGKVQLLVRLYFSGHEKLTEQRWLDRIPSEEPFKEASPRVVHQGEPQFDELVEQFDALE